MQLPKAGLLPAALLVFLAATAGAGIVATDFGARADRPVALLFDGIGRFSDDITAAAFGRAIAIGATSRATKGGRRVVGGLFGRVAQEILEGHQAGSAAEDVVANLRFDVDHQFFKNLEPLGLEFDQRVALA